MIILLETYQSFQFIKNNAYGVLECASKERQAPGPHGSHLFGAGLVTDEVRFV